MAQLSSYSDLTPPSSSARTDQQRAACARLYQRMSGFTFSSRQKLTLLSMGGLASFFFKALAADDRQAWQKRERDKYDSLFFLYSAALNLALDSFTALPPPCFTCGHVTLCCMCLKGLVDALTRSGFETLWRMGSHALIKEA